MGYKVLLADDSITVQKIVKLSLTEEGIEVIAVGNGEQAVQQLETLRPDMVMADVFMPGKDGYEVCEFVKAHPQLKHIPVILLVHAFEPFDPDRAKKVGADHQLTKPFQSIRTLVTTVQDLLASATLAESEIKSSEPLKAVSAPMAAVAPISPQLTSKQPEEEFAVVSSLTPAVNYQAEADHSFNAIVMSDLATTPIPTSLISATPFLMPEDSLPVPLNSPSVLPKSDLLPPSELSVLSTMEWQSALPVLAETSLSETITSSIQPLSLATNQVSDENSMDDVLELSEVLSDSISSPLPAIAPLANQFSSDEPLLAVLANSPFVSEESQSTISSAEPDPSTFASSFDLGVGHPSLATESQPIADTSTAQDVDLGIVSRQEATDTLPISEAVIEEIVNRVIQRLSTNAIQEIAWEVVPEMAELLVRKQISQQKQLTH